MYKPRVLANVAAKFFTLAPDIFGSLVRKLRHVTFLKPIISRPILDGLKILALMIHEYSLELHLKLYEL